MGRMGLCKKRKKKKHTKRPRGKVSRFAPLSAAFHSQLQTGRGFFQGNWEMQKEVVALDREHPWRGCGMKWGVVCKCRRSEVALVQLLPSGEGQGP